MRDGHVWAYYSNGAGVGRPTAQKQWQEGGRWPETSLDSRLTRGVWWAEAGRA